MEKILITGGAGFIGSNASNILSKQGYEIIAFDNLFLGKTRNLEQDVTFIEGDLSREDDLEKVGDVDYIIHLAAASSAPMFTEDLKGSYANNIINHVNVLEFARKHKVKKVLFASTSSIYGNNPLPFTEGQSVTPPNFYSVTKHCQEDTSRIYNEVYGLEIIAFRFMSVYGLHEEHKGRFANLVSQFIWGMEAGKAPTIYGDGLQTRDLTNVKDIVQAFKLAIETPKTFGFTIFNVGSSVSVNMIDLMKMLNRLMGKSIEPSLIENPILNGYVQGQEGDLSKITKELGYAPTITIEQGIEEIVEYRKTNPIPPASLSY